MLVFSMIKVKWHWVVPINRFRFILTFRDEKNFKYITQCNSVILLMVQFVFLASKLFCNFFMGLPVLLLILAIFICWTDNNSYTLRSKDAVSVLNLLCQFWNNSIFCFIYFVFTFCSISFASFLLQHFPVSSALFY